MVRSGICTSAFGIKAPIIKEGDNIVDAVIDSVFNATRIHNDIYDIEDKDIIGITESVVARSFGNYATIDDIAEDVKKKFFGNNLTLVNMIYSRNRFAMILRGIARGIYKKGAELGFFDGKIYLYMPLIDEVGNTSRNHPFTGMDYTEYYREIVESEGVECIIVESNFNPSDEHPTNVLYCGLHDYNQFKETYHSFKYWYTLADILSDRCDWGVLGSNKATEDKIKLFPNIRDCVRVCEDIKDKIKTVTGKNVLVCVYGDGCFHSPMINGILGTSINEFADPITMPGYTDPEIFESTPNEIKIKAFADDKYKELHGTELDDAIRNEVKENNNHNLVGNMTSQGTTPRQYRDLIASLCDLVSGSGQKGTPIVFIKNYFGTYAS